MPYKDPVIRKQKAKERWEKWFDTHDYDRVASCKRYRNKNPKYWLWSSAKRRAKAKNIPFELEKDDIPDFPEICPVALIEIKQKREKGNGPWDHSPTLDRVVPELGYVKNNIQVLSHKGNRWKCDMTIEDVERLLKYMKENSPAIAANARIG